MITQRLNPRSEYRQPRKLGRRPGNFVFFLNTSRCLHWTGQFNSVYSHLLLNSWLHILRFLIQVRIRSRDPNPGDVSMWSGNCYVHRIGKGHFANGHF